MAVKYYDWTAHQANIRPNSTALVDLDTGKNLTYKELEERANRLASWFTKNGIERGDRIALLTRNNTEFFEVQFACWKTGAICLPLNWRLTEK